MAKVITMSLKKKVKKEAKMTKLHVLILNLAAIQMTKKFAIIQRVPAIPWKINTLNHLNHYLSKVKYNWNQMLRFSISILKIHQGKVQP